jgi:hypothetical protein
MTFIPFVLSVRGWTAVLRDLHNQRLSAGVVKGFACA